MLSQYSQLKLVVKHRLILEFSCFFAFIIVVAFVFEQEHGKKTNIQRQKVYSDYRKGWMVKAMSRGNDGQLKKICPTRNRCTLIIHYTTSLYHLNFQRNSKKLPFPHTEVQSPCTPPAQKIDSTPSLV